MLGLSLFLGGGTWPWLLDKCSGQSTAPRSRRRRSPWPPCCGRSRGPRTLLPLPRPPFLCTLGCGEPEASNQPLGDCSLPGRPSGPQLHLEEALGTLQPCLPSGHFLGCFPLPLRLAGSPWTERPCLRISAPSPPPAPLTTVTPSSPSARGGVEAVRPPAQELPWFFSGPGWGASPLPLGNWSNQAPQGAKQGI